MQLAPARANFPSAVQIHSARAWSTICRQLNNLQLEQTFPFNKQRRLVRGRRATGAQVWIKLRGSKVDDQAAAAVLHHPAPHEYLNYSNARRLNSILDRNRTHLNTQAKAERDSYMVFQTQDSKLARECKYKIQVAHNYADMD
jgi:hypothetical protein